MDANVRARARILVITTLLVFVRRSSSVTSPTTSSPVTSPSPCPHPCTCDADLAVVTCDSASLTSLPWLPPGARHVSARGNNITELSNSSFPHQGALLLTLDLSDNPLANVSGDAFSGLALLSRLTLEDCGLTDNHTEALLSHTGLGNLEHLEHLSLARNRLTDLDSLLLSSFTRLRTLDLSYNALRRVPDDLLTSLPNLSALQLQGNSLLAITWNHSDVSSHPLLSLNLSHNGLRHLAADSFSILSNLEHLDVRHNGLADMDVKLLGSLSNLTSLWLGSNPLAHLPNMAFLNCSGLKHLQASAMPNLISIPPLAFLGLGALRELDLHGNPVLEFIHPAAFNPLSSLETLDLSGNHLSTVFSHTFQNLSSLRSVRLSGNPWSCDCDLEWLHGWLVEVNSSGVLQEGGGEGLLCSHPPPLAGLPLLATAPQNFTCEPPRVHNHSAVTWYQIGEHAVLDCVVEGTPRPLVTWLTPRHLVLRHRGHLADHSQVAPEEAEYHSGHPWHQSTVYVPRPALADRMTILPNGSLYIDYVTRADAGPYTCIAENRLGNDTIVTEVKLRYLIKVTVVESIIVGFGTALTFFLVTVAIAATRYVVFWCSPEERDKRRGIREVLDTIQDYKSAQFDKLKDYKQAKVEQISAYKSAKLGQLSAFKTAKIDKIRTYKQVTVTNVIFHMQRMREHYTGQVAKVKDNCSKQVEKLQENYCNQVGKFKDYKSYQVDRIRDNYQGQVMKIREYGSDQLKRLREQYKTQQQHIMKLLELLDIGNCMHVIEAECIRTESMIFDPNITFDLEAKPVHIRLMAGRGGGDEEESPRNSDYLTASSSEEGSVLGLPYILSMESEVVPPPGSESHLPNVSARVPMLPVASSSTALHLPTSSHATTHATSANSKKSGRKHRAATRGHHREGSDSSLDSQSGETKARRKPPHKAGSATNLSQRAKSSAKSSAKPADVSHLELQLRAITPGKESLSSNTETEEYESARESRDQTPEYGQMYGQMYGGEDTPALSGDLSPRPTVSTTHPVTMATTPRSPTSQVTMETTTRPPTSQVTMDTGMSPTHLVTVHQPPPTPDSPQHLTLAADNSESVV